MQKIAISGGFDSLHPGHIAMIEDARQCGEVHIIENLIKYTEKQFGNTLWADGVVQALTALLP